jgi:hypothetical protein
MKNRKLFLKGLESMSPRSRLWHLVFGRDVCYILTGRRQKGKRGQMLAETCFFWYCFVSEMRVTVLPRPVLNF